MVQGSAQTYIVHSQRMAGWLIYRGQKLIKVAQNKMRPGFNIFVFVDSTQLRKDMSEYTPRDAV
ncbi:DUF5659 domain-containing protein [Paenibacillus antri]|uniref:DUF5659 domain-containing protein n=1 Tax=Paenibacillus antri TaxID=2582848 RepID=UPI0026B0D3FA